VELVSNRHLSSISCMKYRYVGGKYMHFITANSHMDKYSCGGLDLLDAKWGWPPALLGPPSRSFRLRGRHGQRLIVVTMVRHFVELLLVTFEKLQISHLVPEIK
jgi:hypothetical protein